MFLFFCDLSYKFHSYSLLPILLTDKPLWRKNLLGRGAMAELLTSFFNMCSAQLQLSSLVFNSSLLYPNFTLSFHYKNSISYGSLTFVSAVVALVSQCYHLFTKKSAANGRTTKCKRLFIKKVTFTYQS